MAPKTNRRRITTEEASTAAKVALAGGALAASLFAAIKYPEETTSLLLALSGDPERDRRRKELGELEEELDAKRRNSIWAQFEASSIRRMLDEARVEDDPDVADLLVVRARRRIHAL